MKPTCASLLVIAAGILSCSPESYRREADDEVYEILADKRSPALGEEAAAVNFSVEAPKSSLRAQLLDKISKGERPVLELSLAEALRVAAENSREFQDQRERLYLSALALTGQRNRYSTIFGAGNDTTVSGVGNDSSQINTNSSISATKILASGARVLGGFVNNFFRVFTSGGGWDTSSLLSLSITQPLMAGFGSEVTLEPLTQAERNVIYSVRNYERFRRTFCVDIVQEYLQVLEQENNLENAVENTASLTASRERSEAMQKAGRLAKFQADQTRQSELAAKDAEITTRARLQTANDRFKITLGLPLEIDLKLDAGVVERLTELGVAKLTLSDDEAVGLALSRRLDLLNSHDMVEDAERGVRVAADALKMGLDLTAAVDVPTENNKNPFKFAWDKVEWQVGLGIDLPLNRVPERNVYRQSMIALSAEKRADSLLRDNITLSIRGSLRNVEAAANNYRNRELQLQLSDERVKSTKLLLEAGRVQARDYLDAQADLNQAKNSLISALITYVVDRLGLLRDLEMLEVGETGLSLDFEALRQWMEEGKKAEEKKDEEEKKK